MKIASFDVDAQKGFTPLCPSELPVPEGDAIVPALNQLAARAELRIGSARLQPLQRRHMQRKFARGQVLG